MPDTRPSPGLRPGSLLVTRAGFSSHAGIRPFEGDLFGIVFLMNPRETVPVVFQTQTGARVLGFGCYETPTNLVQVTVPAKTLYLVLRSQVPCYNIPVGETKGFWMGNFTVLKNLQTQEDHLWRSEFLRAAVKQGFITEIDLGDDAGQDSEENACKSVG